MTKQKTSPYLLTHEGNLCSVVSSSERRWHERQPQFLARVGSELDRLVVVTLEAVVVGVRDHRDEVQGLFRRVREDDGVGDPATKLTLQHRKGGGRRRGGVQVQGVPEFTHTFMGEDQPEEERDMADV